MLWLIVLALKLNQQPVSVLEDSLFKPLLGKIAEENKKLIEDTTRDPSFRILFVGSEETAGDEFFTSEELYQGFIDYVEKETSAQSSNGRNANENFGLRKRADVITLTLEKKREEALAREEASLLEKESLSSEEEKSLRLLQKRLKMNIAVHGNSVLAAAVNSFGKILDFTYDREDNTDAKHIDQDSGIASIAIRKASLEGSAITTFKINYDLVIGGSEINADMAKSVAANFAMAEIITTLALRNPETCSLLPNPQREEGEDIDVGNESVMNWINNKSCIQFTTSSYAAPTYEEESELEHIIDLINSIMTFQPDSLLTYEGEPVDITGDEGMKEYGAQILSRTATFLPNSLPYLEEIKEEVNARGHHSEEFFEQDEFNLGDQAFFTGNEHEQQLRSGFRAQHANKLGSGLSKQPSKDSLRHSQVNFEEESPFKQEVLNPDEQDEEVQLPLKLSSSLHQMHNQPHTQLLGGSGEKELSFQVHPGLDLSHGLKAQFYQPSRPNNYALVPFQGEVGKEPIVEENQLVLYKGNKERRAIRRLLL